MTRSRMPRLVTFNGDTTMALAAASQPVVDQAARTISGLAVPFGRVGVTSQGALHFAAGALTWTDPRRVKLLREHDQRDSVGFARELVELDAAEVDRRLTAAGQPALGVAGIWATYHVPEGANGDQALAEAANGLRDALSVGVQIDAKTYDRMRRANGSPVAGSGQLRETSLVSVPAFDDARVGSVAANAQLVVASWSTPTQGDSMRCQRCHHIHAAGVTECQADHLAAASAALAAASGQPAPQPDPAPQPQPTPPAPQPDPAPQPQPTPPAPQPNPAPQPGQPALAGAAVVTGSPSTYTFDGSRSLVLDAYAGRYLGDAEAAQRFARFNVELADGNPSSVLALAAVMTTADPEAAPVLNNGVPTYRPDMLRSVIDRGRPLNSRVTPIPLRNATPFTLPIEGEFDGVGDHTEGQAHRPEGTLTLSDATATPKAVSGAWRASRELLDSSNPAIDRIAMRAMLRDYRRDTEARFYAALAAATDAIGGVTTVAGLRTQLIDFIDDDTEISFVMTGKDFFTELANDVDGDGRPMLPYVNPTNAAGGLRAGYTGAYVDGSEIAMSSRILADRALIVDANDVLTGESAVQQFRFEEVEGPGVIKFAIWAYYVAAVLDLTGVRELSSLAEPVA